MASRIAVMHHGEIQQFATPDAVYNRPANLFVARFLGTPPMNTVPARLARGDGLTPRSSAPASRRDPPAAAAAGRQRARFVDRDVVLGIRPGMHLRGRTRLRRHARRRDRGARSR